MSKAWLYALTIVLLAACDQERKPSKDADSLVFSGGEAVTGGPVADLDRSRDAVIFSHLKDTLLVGSTSDTSNQTIDLQFRIATITSSRAVKQSVFSLPSIESAFFRDVDTIDVADISRIVPNAALVVLGKGCRLVSQDGAHWPSSMRTLDVSECEIDDREELYKSLNACRLDTLVLSYSRPSDISSLHTLESVVAVSLDLKAPLRDIREFYRMKRLTLLIATNVHFMDASMMKELSLQKKFEFSYLYPFK